MDSLSIAHYIPAVRLSDGGVVRAVLDWCRLLAHHGHRVTLLTYDATDVPQEWFAHGTETPQIVALPRANRLGLLNSTALDLARSVIERADVLHLHGLWLTSNLQLAGVANDLETPYLLTTHGMLDNWATSQRFLKKRIFHALIGRRFIRRAARVHCTATEEQRQASPWLDGTPVSVLPYLVDLAPFRNIEQRTNAAANFDGGKSIPTLLFLGRLHVKKGIDLLIELISELRQRGQAARLLIAGQGQGGYEAELRDQTRRLGLDDAVQFLGLITGDAKTSLFQSADLFVLPTSQENFGIALIEAAACGIPLLTTRGVDIWRELEAAGATIAERSVNGFADAIERLLRDRAQLQKGAGTMRDWVFATLDPEYLLPKYERLYESVARRRSTDARQRSGFSNEPAE